MVNIVRLNLVTDEVVAAFARLIKQLSFSPLDAPDRAQLESMIQSQAVTILLARDPVQEDNQLRVQQLDGEIATLEIEARSLIRQQAKAGGIVILY